MNITLSTGREIIEKARRQARKRGTTLNALVREYIETLAGGEREGAAEEFRSIALSMPGRSAPGFRFNREEVHQRDG